MKRIPRWPAVVLSGFALGCAGTHVFDRSAEPGTERTPTNSAGSIVITGEALGADPGRTVLDAIRHAVPAMRVTDWSIDHCPVLQLRGRDSVEGSSDPDVYVDGTRTIDTCPLVSLQAMETTRIEVYPQGVTIRPGYPSRGHGLILIFLQRA